MTSRKSHSDKELELYVQRFNNLGLELPEAATANPASMRSVASFLMKHGVFGEEEDLPEPEKPTGSEGVSGEGR